jgi:hypothetical protein
MFHVVFIDPPEQAYVSTEDEATAWIKSRLPTAVFSPWHARTKRAYPDEQKRDLAKTQAGNLVRCTAFIIDTW